MTKIKELAESIIDELESAKKYAEKYVECKAKGNTQWASRFKEMSEDELRHAMYLHEYAVKEIEELKVVYTPPEDMLEKWDKKHKEYVEKSALVKQMLTL